MIKKVMIFGMAMFFLWACSGKQPQPSWTAEEYFQYAKEKYDDEDYYNAVNDFTVVILRYPGSFVADSSQYLLGMCHFKLEEFIISSAEFSKLINTMSRSPLVPDAQLMLAESYYEMSPRPPLDQEYTLKALREYQIFLEDFPTHKRREEAEKKIFELREKLAEKQWMNAELYRKMREFKSSLIYFDIVLEKYYDTEYADDALLGRATVHMDTEEYDLAREDLTLFKDKFPNSDLLSAAERMLTRAVNRVTDDEPESED